MTVLTVKCRISVHPSGRPRWSSQCTATFGSSKNKALPSSSTLNLAGNNIAYLRCNALSRLLTSWNCAHFLWTSLEKLGNTATWPLPRAMLPFSLVSRRILSLSLKLRNLAIKVLGGGSHRRRLCWDSVCPFHCEHNRKGLSSKVLNQEGFQVFSGVGALSLLW